MNWYNGGTVFIGAPIVGTHFRIKAAPCAVEVPLRFDDLLLEAIGDGNKADYGGEEGLLVIATPEVAAKISTVFERDALVAAMTGDLHQQQALAGCHLIAKWPDRPDLNGIIQLHIVRNTMHLDVGNEAFFTPITLQQIYQASFIWCSLGKPPDTKPPDFQPKAE